MGFCEVDLGEVILEAIEVIPSCIREDKASLNYCLSGHMVVLSNL